MPQPQTMQSQATQSSAELLLVIKCARKDGVITEAEIEEIERKASETYTLNEVDDTIDYMCAQLKRRGLVSANVPLAARIKDLIQLARQRKGSPACENWEPEAA